MFEWLENNLQYISIKYKVQSVRTWFETACGTPCKSVSLSACRLKPLDIEFMKRLHEKVNVIPLIAKADTLTPEECQQFKKQVSSFPSCTPLQKKKISKSVFFLFHCGHRYLGRDVHPEANPNKVEPLWCYSCLCDDVWKVFCKLFICINTKRKFCSNHVRH